LNNHMRPILDAGRTHRYIFATSFVYKSSKDATGVLTGSSVPANEYEYQRSLGRELIGFSPKIVLITKYPLENHAQELMVINIHARNSVSWKKMAVQVLNALKLAQDHDGPVIFAGDFNTWSNKKEAFVLRAMERAGFSNVEFPNGNTRMHLY